MSVIESPETQTLEPTFSAAEVLMRAAAIVRERWCQFEAGDSGGPRCAMGAIHEASVDFLHYVMATSRVRCSIGGSIAGWNDADGRTAEEVAEGLERAAIGG